MRSTRKKVSSYTIARLMQICIGLFSVLIASTIVLLNVNGIIEDATSALFFGPFGLYLMVTRKII